MPGFTVGTYDVGANNKANLLAAINAENGTDYTLAEYAFTDPKRVTIPNPVYNTSIKLGPLAATGKIGFKTIYYNRIHVDEIGPLKITWQNEEFLTELLPRLSEKYGISLTPDDVYEQRIIPPTAPLTEVSITLNFKETSVAYYGGSVIVLGMNDPALEFETPENLPYKNDLIFYVNNFTKTKTGGNYLESSVLGIASDRVRSRTLNVSNLDSSAYVSIIKNTYTDAQRAKLEEYLPFVFTWTVAAAKTVRGVTIYGDVVEINETSNHVEKISSVITVDALNQSELNTARDKVLVREGTQAIDGTIYFLVGDPSNSKVMLMKSTDYGDNFEEVTVNTTNRAAFNYGNWENVVIHDLMVFGNKLSILVTNPNTYGTHPTKSSNGPAVEEYNLSNGNSDYFPINPEFATNTKISLVFNSNSKLRFVTPDSTRDILDVVGIARTSNTLEPVAVYFTRESGLEFTAEVLGSTLLDYPVFGISAWSKPLVKDAAAQFVSFEILTYVPSSSSGTSSDYFLMETGMRGQDYNLSYGILTFSTARKNKQLSGWVENHVDLGGGSEPKYVTVTDRGRRNHYVFAGGNGIYKTKYDEVDANEYVPTLEKIFDAGSHPGFNLECDIGNGSYQVPAVAENNSFAATFTDYPDSESLQPPIGYSFIVQNSVTNESMWLVSPNASTQLQERMFGKEYSLLGSTPAAVFSDAAKNIYAVTTHQGIYKSTDQGNTWVDFSALKNYYSSSEFIGQARIAFKASDFNDIVASNGIVYMDVKPSRDIEVFKISTLEPNYNLELKDRVIYRVDAAKPSGDVEINSTYITNSLNNTSTFSPRNTISWDTDASNNIRALAKYNFQGSEQVLDQLDLPSSIVNDVLQVYTDVGFLDLKAVAITYNPTDGYNLCLVDTANAVERRGLWQSDTPEFGSFEPQEIIPLWNGNDNSISYTPIIITSTGREVLILERNGITPDVQTINIQTLTIPDDNNEDIKWFPMFSSNRRDRCVFQEGNGIFKVTYSWDGPNQHSVIGLEKLFDVSSLNVSKVYSGCQYNLPNAVPFNESTIGPWDPYGKVISSDCEGTNKRDKVADGYGGFFYRISEPNSPDCGYVVATPGDTGLGGGNFNVGP